MTCETNSQGEEQPQSCTAIIRVDPLNDPTAIALYNEALRLRQYAQIRIVQSVEDIAAATNDLSIVSKLKKAIEEKRKEYVDPINAHLRAVNDAFKRLVAPLDDADSMTRGKIMTFKREEALRAAEVAEINRLRLEATRREAALNEGEIKELTQLIPEVLPVPAKVQADIATLGTAKVWKWELLDLAKVPDEFKVIDAAKIGKVVRAGIREIPGVRIYSEDTLRVTNR